MSLALAAAPAGPSLLSTFSYRFRRHWLASAIGIIALTTIFLSVYAIVSSGRVNWGAISGYLTADVVLKGVWTTIQLTVISMVLGTLLALVLAAMRGSLSTILRAISFGYMWFFRGTPLLVQLVFWFNISLFLPSIAGISTNSIVTPFGAALLGLTLNVAAYEAEIIRAGILAVDNGQTEAGLAVGMRRHTVLRKIVLPQAARVIVPPTSNQFIDMLKATSLVSVIGTGDLMTAVQSIYSQNFLVIELLMVASIWYLLMTSIAITIQWFLERRLSRSIVGRGMVRA